MRRLFSISSLWIWLIWATGPALAQNAPQTRWQEISNRWALELISALAAIDSTDLTYSNVPLVDENLPPYGWDPDVAEKNVRLLEGFTEKVQSWNIESLGLPELDKRQLEADRRVLTNYLRTQIEINQANIADGFVPLRSSAFHLFVSIGATKDRAPQIHRRWIETYIRGDGENPPVLSRLTAKLERALQNGKVSFPMPNEYVEVYQAKIALVTELAIKLGVLVRETGMSQEEANALLQTFATQVNALMSVIDIHQEKLLQLSPPPLEATAFRPRYVDSLEDYHRNLQIYGVHANPAELETLVAQAWPAAQAEFEALVEQVARKYGLDPSITAIQAHLLERNGIPNRAALLATTQEALGRLSSRLRQVISLPADLLPVEECQVGNERPELKPCLAPSPYIEDPHLAAVFGTGSPVPSVIMLPSFEYLSETKSAFLIPQTLEAVLAHEGLPGHALQLLAIQSQNTSIIRALFASNSASEEGWALYAEQIALQQIPADDLETRLFFSQALLRRLVRIRLDVGINTKTISDEEAARTLESIGASPEAARLEVQEVFRAEAGKGAAYYYGYHELLQLKARAQALLGERFVEKEFNDRVVALSFLPFREMWPILELQLQSK